MTKFSSDKFNPLTQQLAISQESTISIVRSLGYALLLLALFDWVFILTPPNLMNPVWEFQAFGSLVERIPIVLIGLVLIFYGEETSRNRWEPLFLKFLSWFTLLLAVTFFLLIPLGVGNTIRLSNRNNSQLEAVSKQQVAQVEQFGKQINQATPEQIENVLKQQRISLGDKKPDEFKNDLLTRVSQAKQQVSNRSDAVRSNQNMSLFKNSTKWNLGSLISAALLFSIWKGTTWARK